MNSNKYCVFAVTNMESVLKNHGLSLSPKYVTPIICSHCIEIDVTG